MFMIFLPAVAKKGVWPHIVCYFIAGTKDGSFGITYISKKENSGYSGWRQDELNVVSSTTNISIANHGRVTQALLRHALSVLTIESKTPGA